MTIWKTWLAVGAVALTGACGTEENGARTTATPAAEARVAKDDPGERGGKVLDARLTGAPRPYAGSGAANAIRGVPAGGLPWVLGSGKAKLFAGGRLVVEVEGLVFDPADAAVIARGLAGQNTVASFKAIVSCQSVVDGAAAVVNVESPLAPATVGPASAGGGDASISATLALPSPCIAPIVFVTSPTGAWFAATGS
jgi:hypothetical protein